MSLPHGPTSPRSASGVRGFFVSVGSLVSARAFLALSQIIVLPFLARQLSVEDFALMALAMTVVIFASVLSDAGLGRSLIRTPGYDHVEWSSVFWLMAAVGVALALATLALAPVAAWFFDAPDLAPMLLALAVVPLFQAASAAANAEIERREDYKGIARVQVVSTMVALALAVGLAFAGAGVWALVAQQIALAGTRFIGIIRLSQFCPSAVFSRSSVGPHLIFARDALLVSAILAVRQQAAVVMLGKFLSPVALGLFAMSHRFSRLPQFGLAGPMSSVVFVRMSKAQASPQRLAEIYLASMRLLAIAILPPVAMIAVAGEAIFTVFLSAEWAGVAPIFTLSIAGLVLEAVTLLCLSCLFRAVARTDLLVRISAEGAVLRLILTAIAAMHSLEAVAASFTLWGLIMAPRGWQMARELVPLEWRACLGTFTAGLTASIVVVLTHLGLVAWLAPSDPAEMGLAILLAFIGLGLAAAMDRKAVMNAVRVFRPE